MQMKYMAAIALALSVHLSASAALPPTNQYGGYDNVEQLSVTEFAEFQETPKYKAVMSDLVKIMQDFEQKSQAAVSGDVIGEIPQIPELTLEQKSFLTKGEILAWNEARQKIQDLEAAVSNIKSQAEKLDEKSNVVQQSVEKAEKTMATLPEYMDDSFTRDANGKLVFTPKVDLSNLPELKMPEANCDLLDSTH